MQAERKWKVKAYFFPVDVLYGSSEHLSKTIVILLW